MIRDRTTIPDTVCTACGCLCDDISIMVEQGCIVEAGNACSLGREWFLRARSAADPVAMIDGHAVTLEQAIEEAARVLAAAQYPLVFGLSHSTCEAQGAAVAIADWLGACVDTATSVRHGVSGTSFAGVGEVTCTLGEVRHRGDLVIFWGADPAISHPRHAERYSLIPEGMFVPKGRADRTCVVVDVHETETSADADLFLRIKPGRDFEALWTVRAIIQGIELDPVQVEKDTGVSLAAWRDLACRMKQARFGVIFFGAGLAATRGRHLNADALMALTRDMNMFTRFVCLPMRGKGNVAGADDVLLWTTGYPFAVNLSRGYPRFGPGEFAAANALARREVDVALVVGSALIEDLSPAARDHLATIPCVVIDSEANSHGPTAHVAFRTAPAGLGAAGTVYRMDDVPLPINETIRSPFPGDVEILSRIETQIKSLRGYGKASVLKERTRRV